MCKVFLSSRTGNKMEDEKFREGNYSGVKKSESGKEDEIYICMFTNDFFFGRLLLNGIVCAFCVLLPHSFHPFFFVFLLKQIEK